MSNRGVGPFLIGRTAEMAVLADTLCTEELIAAANGTDAVPWSLADLLLRAVRRMPEPTQEVPPGRADIVKAHHWHALDGGGGGGGSLGRATVAAERIPESAKEGFGMLYWGRTPIWQNGDRAEARSATL